MPLSKATKEILKHPSYQKSVKRGEEDLGADDLEEIIRKLKSQAWRWRNKKDLHDPVEHMVHAIQFLEAFESNMDDERLLNGEYDSSYSEDGSHLSTRSSDGAEEDSD